MPTVVDPGGREAVGGALAAAVAAAEPGSALSTRCRIEGTRVVLPDGDSVDLARYERIRVVGAGKATPRMFAGARALFGEVAAGAVATKDGYGIDLGEVDLWEAGHPLPDVRSMAAAAEALRIARACGPRDLLLCLLSGGASALWAAPPDGIALGDLRIVTEGLLRSGVPIQDANVVRKHLSRIAGGFLASVTGAARLVTFAVSDVVGAGPHAIGSGPTLPDPSRFRDALEILERYEVEAPCAVRSYFLEGMAGRVPETPKPGTVIRSHASFHVVASLDSAVAGAAEYLRRIGYSTRVVSRQLSGEARSVGEEVARYALAARRSGGYRQALIWAGETTVTVRGNGKGGRNQEAALAAALRLAGDESVTLAFLATDGTDGPTDAAGGCIDGFTVSKGEATGLSARAALANNDAYVFLSAAGDLVRTGPTGTNVNDVVIALIT